MNHEDRDGIRREPKAQNGPAAFAGPRPLGTLVVLFAGLLAAGSTQAAETILHLGVREAGAGMRDGFEQDARFCSPVGLAVDELGNVVVADSENHVIRMYRPDGEISSLAGLSGVAGADDGFDAGARFSRPSGVAVGGNHGLWIADNTNHTIRLIDAARRVSTVAGKAGIRGSADGPAADARFQNPMGIATAPDGSVFIADTSNHTIRRLSTSGVVSTFVGQAGVPGTSDGFGSGARFTSPRALVVDAGGNLWVADTGNQTIRKIAPDGRVTTLAGKAGVAGSADGNGSVARFDSPAGIALAPDGSLVVADRGNNTIRRVSPDGAVLTIAGSALFPPGARDGRGAGARFNTPSGVAVDPLGRVFVSDTANHTLRLLDTDGDVSTIGGLAIDLSEPGRIVEPTGVAEVGDGSFYVSDSSSYVIVRIDLAGRVTLLAGQPGTPGADDGTGSEARFERPTGLTIGADGNLYVCDTYGFTIRRVTPSGQVTTLAGSPGQSGAADGAGSQARFGFPVDIASRSDGRLVVADAVANTIRLVGLDGMVTTLAGRSGESGASDGDGASARFSFPSGVGTDRDGHTFVADYLNQLVRRIDFEGRVTTVAGTPGPADEVDGDRATARLSFPIDVAARSDGDLLVASYGAQTIRKIDTSSNVTTIAGQPWRKGACDGTGTLARFQFLRGIVATADGGYVVSDTLNHALRRATEAAPGHLEIDRAVAEVGVERNVCWRAGGPGPVRWRLTRRPGQSRVSLLEMDTPCFTFRPDETGSYRIEVVATDAAGRTAIEEIGFLATPPLDQGPPVTRER